jgi:Zn-dependent M28 family amino/carboxypeptidase
MSDPIDPTILEARLRQHVATLARTPRTPGSREHRRAAEYIRTHLEEAGWTVQEGQFHELGFGGINLLTEPVPEELSRPLVIVAAHYDSGPTTPGADDNASAVAALLELAGWIRFHLPPEPSCQLQLVAYDLEEYGMVGSLVHSRELQRRGTAVRGMISLEMLGYTDQRPGSQRLPPHLAHLYPTVGNFIGVCGNDDSLGFLQVVTRAMKRIAGLPVESLAVPGRGEMLPEVRLSDHSSFWDRGYQALIITDTSFFRNPHYHRASDTPETLDYPFLAKVTAGVCAAVEALLK